MKKVLFLLLMCGYVSASSSGLYLGLGASYYKPSKVFKDGDPYRVMNLPGQGDCYDGIIGYMLENNYGIECIASFIESGEISQKIGQNKRSSLINCSVINYMVNINSIVKFDPNDSGNGYILKLGVFADVMNVKASQTVAGDSEKKTRESLIFYGVNISCGYEVAFNDSFQCSLMLDCQKPLKAMHRKDTGKGDDIKGLPPLNYGVKVAFKYHF